MPDKRREKLLLDDWKDPEGPAGNQIKIQTMYSGVSNGTERSFQIRGPYNAGDEHIPFTFGYQNVGKVIEVGPDVTKFKVGDIVYSDKDHHEFVVAADNGNVITIPDNVDPKLACFWGVMSVAMRSCRHADIQMGTRVLVVGAGIIGQTCAQIATLTGGVVTLVNRSEPRLEIARKIGMVHETIMVPEGQWDSKIEPESFDVVIDQAGVVGMENDMINALKKRGTLLLIAGRTDVTFNLKKYQRREINITTNQHFMPDDLEQISRLTKMGLLKIEPFIQDVVPVDKAKEIYDTLRDEPQKLFGTIFKW
jgi:2-desacetyl-2-hydroxyethyl bacteriochlorophyllide A dehydrogenase